MSSARGRFLLGLAGLALGAVATVSAAPVDKVEICHKGQLITVGAPAVAAHLAHGDTEGPCPGPIGACCFAGFVSPVCEDMPEEQCMLTAMISWVEGESCPGSDPACAGMAVTDAPEPAPTVAVERVEICHKGNVITVGEPAVAAHLAHGDALGACPELLGRCCQGGFTGPVCYVSLEEDCFSSFISWTAGESCPDGDATCY